MRTALSQSLVLLTACLALAACGSDKGGDACDLADPTSCEEGLVCETVSGAEPGCFTPVRVEGRVFDSTTDLGIEGAQVVALDVNGGAVSEVSVTGIDGAYSLPVPVERTSDGAALGFNVTLRVDAQDYLPFPKAPRAALPIDLNDGVTSDEATVVQNATTDVALIPLPGDTSGLGSISGRVEPGAGGVLILAVAGGSAIATAITDNKGAFVLFNVAAGDVVVEGYRSGVVIEPEAVNVPAGANVTDVVLSASEDGLATVVGSVNLVNPGDGDLTSVILVVDSTFDPDVVRGEAPAGLRAGDISGAFEIQGVPPGRYAVLAAFENDFLVRDPDEGIAGTDIVFIDVPAGGTVTLDESFKVTGAMAVVSPGADGIDIVTDAEPVLRWERDSSVDGYELRVFDALGDMVHEDTMVPGATDATITYTWAGASLIEGMIYQFRVVSFADSPSMGRQFRSATEDLKGVFLWDPTPAP